jgi:cytochrome c
LAAPRLHRVDARRKGLASTPAAHLDPGVPDMKRIAAVVAAALLPALALAEGERASTKEAEMMVHKAVQFLNHEGKEKAFPVFSDPKGPFTYRDLYIVVLDPKSVVLAHGVSKERIGKDFWNAKDADGKFFSREMVQVAAAQGKGWSEYKFQNPATGKVEQKVAYFERVGDLTVLCGAYKP